MQPVINTKMMLSVRVVRVTEKLSHSAVFFSVGRYVYGETARVTTGCLVEACMAKVSTKDPGFQQLESSPHKAQAPSESLSNRQSGKMRGAPFILKPLDVGELYKSLST